MDASFKAAASIKTCSKYIVNHFLLLIFFQIKHQIKNVQNMKTTYDRHLKKVGASSPFQLTYSILFSLQAYHAYIAACQSSTDPIDISILDQEYQIAVDLSQSSHWTHHWETSLDDIQSLETNRLQILKSIVNTLAHMLTYTCSNDEQVSSFFFIHIITQ